MRTAVDVLTMSATPIPRTLEMSLTGIREMTTILTPPEERHPILTFVGAYDPRQIAAAIRRELLRDGQVFYIHNRVESINRAAARLAELVPEARIAVAHGQMGEDALEKIMVGFWEKRLRRAGLHHDRRVRPRHPQRQHPDRRAGRHVRPLAAAPDPRPGRPGPRARLRLLPLPAREAAHRDWPTTGSPPSRSTPRLGAGMAVAMKDLEIRGAGNLLGGEQSGHIAGVGFDLYMRLVGEAVAEFRGEAGERASSARSRSTCRSTPTCRTTTCPASGCGWRPTAHWPSATTDDAVDAVRAGAARPLRPAAAGGGEPAGRRPVQGRLPALRDHRGVAAGPVRAVLPGAAARVGADPAATHYDKTLYKPAVATMAAARPKGVAKPDGSFAVAQFGGEPLRDQALLTWCVQTARHHPGPGAGGRDGVRGCKASGPDPQELTKSETAVKVRPPSARRLAVLPVVALLGLGLSGCQSKAGAAAVVDGHKISESSVGRSVPTTAKQPDQARRFVLELPHPAATVHRGPERAGGAPTDAELRANHDTAVPACCSSSWPGPPVTVR